MHPSTSSFFFFNDTATTEIYTLSLHDALPISIGPRHLAHCTGPGLIPRMCRRAHRFLRSEEHTSELQSQSNLVCRLLLEKKKKNPKNHGRVSMPVASKARIHNCMLAADADHS